MERFYRAPMPARVDVARSPASGSRARLPVDGAGNIITTQTVPLLTQSGLSWGPWAITLDPMTTSGYQCSPYPPQAGFGATGQPRAIVRFGVGGLTRVVEFDYPFAGGLVVVNTDRVEVAVRAMRASAVVPTDAPQVGAWLTPASQQAEATPVQISNPAKAASAFIPAFARSFVICPFDDPGVAVPAGKMLLRFSAFGGSALWDYQLSYPAGGPTQPFRVSVPPLATLVEIIDATAPSWSSFWEISLA